MSEALYELRNAVDQADADLVLIEADLAEIDAALAAIEAEGTDLAVKFRQQRVEAAGLITAEMVAFSAKTRATHDDLAATLTGMRGPAIDLARGDHARRVQATVRAALDPLTAELEEMGRRHVAAGEKRLDDFGAAYRQLKARADALTTRRAELAERRAVMGGHRAEMQTQYRRATTEATASWGRW